MKAVNDSTDARFVIVARSQVRVPSCLKQLTVWVESREEIEFAIRQLDRHHGAWMLKRNADGKVAVFVPGESDHDSE